MIRRFFAACRKRPLALLLPAQALLYSWNLGLLAPWGDEISTLSDIGKPVGQLFQTLANDVHPPLYFLLLHFWAMLPAGLSEIVQARAFSVTCALGATLALDRLWAQRMPMQARLTLLALWVFSPFLLLYSRMARSYSLQSLLTIIGLYWVLRLRKDTSLRALAAATASTAALIYVHYVPGLAIVAALNLTLVWQDRLRLRRLIMADAALLLVYLPWLWTLPRVVGFWSGKYQYALTGSALFELPLKLAFAGFSFTMGEAAPDWLVLAGGAVTIMVAALAAAGARRNPELAWTAGIAALVGFLGVYRFVSYPFVPARMLYVYPFFLLAVVAGLQSLRRGGAAATGLLLACSVSGIWCYFHTTGFLNLGYVLPTREIADEIRSRSTAADSVVIVDGFNADYGALEFALGGSGMKPVRTDVGHVVPYTARLVADSSIRTIWFMRNTHIHPVGQANEAVEALLRRTMTAQVRYYLPLSPLQVRAARALGIESPPQYFYELLEFRR